VIKDKPRRFHRVFPHAALYFVTFCTRNRKKIDDLGRVNNAFAAYCTPANEKYHIAVGRYVIMPDYVHLFVRGNPDFALGRWVGGLKRALAAAVFDKFQATNACDTRATTAVEAAVPAAPVQKRSLWQPGFFDHVLRSDESYAQKWKYVRDNPVRADLVERWDQWPHQGEIVPIDRA
jgi:REP-associated tyrosine transposase